MRIPHMRLDNKAQGITPRAGGKGITPRYCCPNKLHGAKLVKAAHHPISADLGHSRNSAILDRPPARFKRLYSAYLRLGYKAPEKFELRF